MSSNSTNGVGGPVSALKRREEASAIVESTETMADYISKCAQLENHVPILAFPKHEDAYGDFERFTAKDLNDLADRAAMLLIRQGLVQLSEKNAVTITLIGYGGAQYVATFLALAKLGYSIFVMSPRFPASVMAALLEKAECKLILFTENMKARMEEVRALREVKTLPMVTRAELHFDSDHFQPPNYDTTSWSRSSKICFLWHSSGSTGIPKIFPMSQKNIMDRLRFAVKGPYFAKPLFLTSSVYNSAGTTFFILALCNSETMYYYNDLLPYNTKGLVTVMEEARPQITIIVPYALAQLSTSSAGLEALKNCAQVNSFGAVCPTELGNKLVEQGVRLNSGYAMSETSTLMNSAFRDASTDKDWDYMAPYPNTKDHIWMKPLTESGDLYECVILPGLATCPTSNSDDDPPGSFHTGDVFVAHATRPDRWKLISRRDDLVRLSSSESFFALPLEDHVRTHPLVDEAVVFGIGRPKLGLLVFVSEAAAAKDLAPDEVLERVWPRVKDMNAQNKPWTRIARDMVVVVVPYGRSWPKTDKQNMIRPQVYHEFEKEINDMYEGLNEADVHPHREY